MPPLLVTARRCLSILPTVAIAEQLGIKNLEVASWFVLYADARAPNGIVLRISEAVAKVMRTATYRERATAQGAEAIYLDPNQLRAFATVGDLRWREVIREAGIRVDRSPHCLQSLPGISGRQLYCFLTWGAGVRQAIFQ